MRDFFDRALGTVQGYVPEMLAAVAVLVVGWLVALLVASMVRKLLEKTTVDDKIAGWITDSTNKDVDSEKIVSRVVFWILMVIVLVAFFQVLGLSQVTEPLNSFLSELFAFLPRLLGAGALLALAWLIATGLRFVVRRALDAANIDERFGAAIDDSGPRRNADAAEDEDAIATREAAEDTPSLARTLSETVYWLVFLLFLPAILGALALDGLLEPVNELVNEVLAFLPNLFVAGLILLVGWLVARIIRRIVTNLLAAAGLDRLSGRVGIEKVLGQQTLSGVVGLIVYVLILIPVLISALDALQIQAITEPASGMLDTILAAIPRIFAAGLLLLLAWILAKIVAGLIENVLAAIGFDRLFERIGFTQASDKDHSASSDEQRRPSQIVGTLVMIVVLLFAAIEAFRLLEFGALAAILGTLTVFLGKVALGVVVFGLGIYLGDLAAKTIRSSGMSQAALLATSARIAILILAGAMALRQIDVAEDIINLAFGLTLGAIAVSAAIAFGWGGRHLAERYLERLDASARSSSEGSAGGSPPAPPPSNA